MNVLQFVRIRCTNAILHSKCYALRSMSTDIVRVRFAPSPTGFMHLGSLRTAMYNYLFSKKHNGQFILRIEDTDQTRIVESSVQSIVDTLEWAGLPFDIGPIHQSSRLELYNEKVAELLEKKLAYRCFCTEHRLDLLRRESIKNRTSNRYDRRCFHLSEDEIKEKIEKNVPFTVRFKLEDEDVTFDDLVFGHHTKNVFQSESDPIILKSNGFPVYHLANVVDDHDMKVTHVFRGSEWLSSTSLHILIYRAFGWQIPQFIHLPLIINKDGSKLSKRLDSVRIDFLRESGYSSKALINYLRSIGGGFSNLHQDEVYSLDKLSNAFKPETIAANPAKLDVDKLNYYSRMVTKEDVRDNLPSLVDMLRSSIAKKFGEKILSRQSNERLKFIISWSQDRIFTINDLVTQYSFIWTEPEFANLAKFSFLNILDDNFEDICKIITGNGGEQESTPKLIKTYCDKNNIKYNKFMQLIRVALAGVIDGPPVAEILTLLGAEKSCERLRNAAKHMRTLENVSNTSVSN